MQLHLLNLEYPGNSVKLQSGYPSFLLVLHNTQYILHTGTPAVAESYRQTKEICRGLRAPTKLFNHPPNAELVLTCEFDDNWSH